MPLIGPEIGGHIGLLMGDSLALLFELAVSPTPVDAAAAQVNGGSPSAMSLAPKARKSTAITALFCRASQFFISSSWALACPPPSRWWTSGPAIVRLAMPNTVSEPMALALESPSAAGPVGSEHHLLRVDAGE